MAIERNNPIFNNTGATWHKAKRNKTHDRNADFKWGNNTGTPITNENGNDTIFTLSKNGTVDAGFFDNLPQLVSYGGNTYRLARSTKGRVYYQATRKLKKGKNHLHLRESGASTTSSGPPSSSGAPSSGYSSGKTGYYVKTTSPLVFDLNGDGKTHTVASKQCFDIDNDGKLDTINKIAAGDGLLAFDHDGDGRVGENAREIFGNYTANQKFANGFDALKAIAKKELGDAAVADGKLDVAEIKALEDKIKLGLKVDGAVKLLSDLGVSGINLNYNPEKQGLDANGNVMGESSAFTQAGKDKAIVDVWFKKH